MLSLPGDFFRFWWGLLYWNSRKAVFRLRGRRGQCPCHHPSDSGKGGETGCEAAASWNEPSRFRHVCPLLERRPEGWRCSVDKNAVRPFWLRAFVSFGGLALILYILGAAGLFLLLRGVGYDEIRFRHTVWPGAWTERRAVQARHYLDRGSAALAEGNLRYAALSLSTAYEMDPGNYEAGIRLAQIWRVTRQRTVSDRLFERLLTEHPQRSGETAYIWLLTLLGAREYSSVAELSVRMLQEEISNRPAWTRALFFASRRTDDPDALKRLLDQEVVKEGDWRSLYEIEMGLLSEDRLPALRTLAVIREDEAEPFLLYYQVERLIEIREFAAAETALDCYNGRIGPVEEQKLRWELTLRRGWSSLLSMELDGRTLDPKQLEFITAALIRTPDTRVFQAVYENHRPDSVHGSRLDQHSVLSLAAAAAAAGDAEAQSALARHLHEHFEISPVLLEQLAALESAEAPPAVLARIFRTLPFPMEVFYALLERHD